MASIIAKPLTPAQRKLLERFKGKLPEPTVIITPSGAKSTSSGYVPGSSSSTGGSTKVRKKSSYVPGSSSSTGGGTSSKVVTYKPAFPGITVATPQVQAQTQAKLRLVAQRMAEQKRLQELANREAERIEKERKNLLSQGGTSTRQRFGNSIIESTRKDDRVIEKIIDLQTGEVKIREYKSGVTMGGVDTTAFTKGGDVLTVGTKKETERTQGVIEPYERKKGGVISEALQLGKLSDTINTYRDKIRTAQIRRNVTPLQGASLLATSFVSGILDLIIGYVDLPQSIIYLTANPREILNIPSNIKTAGSNFGYLLNTSPGEAIAYIGGQVVGIKASSVGLKYIKQIGNKAINKLNSKYIGSVKAGDTIKLKVSPTKTVELKVVKTMPREKFISQLDRAGKRINAVSSQADDLFNLLNKRKIVRKPIPGEARFKVTTKRLLEKFDKGTITKNELFKLDTLLKAEGTKGLLERSFFLDPTGKVRPSRLGITDKKTKFLDYLSEDITFRKSKPQIFFFDDLKIESYPKNIRPIINKMKKGISLTKKEGDMLLQWKLTPSGKAKPFGFLSSESEVTISPKEILRKTKKLGTISFKGQNVPIWKVEIYRPTDKLTRGLLNKLQTRTITNTERLTLKRLLQKQTGINYASYYSPSARYISPLFVSYTVAGKLSFKPISKITPRRTSSKITPRITSSKITPRITSSKITSRITSSKITSSKITPRRTSSKITSSKITSSKITPRRTSSKITPKILAKKQAKPIIQKVRGFTQKKLPKSVDTYYVKLKVKDRIVNLTPRPLTLNDARDFLAYRVDNGLSRSAWFEPLGKTKDVVTIPNQMKGYYSKVSNKLRPYKIRVGNKVGIRMGYIEKRKYFNDTLGERRAMKQLRRLTPEQRKKALINLEKARQVKNSKRNK